MTPFQRKFTGLFNLSGLSQSAYAAELAQHGFECSDGTVKNWLDGVHEPKLSAIAAIARLAGVDANYLVFDEIAPLDVATMYPLPAGVERFPGAKRRIIKTSAPPKNTKRRGG